MWVKWAEEATSGGKAGKVQICKAPGVCEWCLLTRPNLCYVDVVLSVKPPKQEVMSSQQLQNALPPNLVYNLVCRFMIPPQQAASFDQCLLGADCFFTWENQVAKKNVSTESVLRGKHTSVLHRHFHSNQKWWQCLIRSLQHKCFSFLFCFKDFLGSSGVIENKKRQESSQRHTLRSWWAGSWACHLLHEATASYMVRPP